MQSKLIAPQVISSTSFAIHMSNPFQAHTYLNPLGQRAQTYFSICCKYVPIFENTVRGRPISRPILLIRRPMFHGLLETPAESGKPILKPILN